MKSLFFIILFLPFVSCECPFEWTVGYNNNCYFIPSIFLSWNNSVTFCNNVGGWLTSVENEDEYNYLKSLSVNQDPLYPVWIGLERDTTVSFDRYTWIDGTVGGYKHFNDKDKVKDECVGWRTLNEDDGYETLPCLSDQPFICKIKSSGSPSSTVSTQPTIPVNPTIPGNVTPSTAAPTISEN